MDDQVKARLIGATVLVAIAVALVPELLSGPKRVDAPAAEPGTRTTRSLTIDLVTPTASGPADESPASSAGQARETPRLPTRPAAGSDGNAPLAPAAARERTPRDASPSAGSTATAPAPASSAAKSPTAAAPTAATAPKPEPRPRAQAVEPAAAARGAFAVQVGAFGSADAARRLVTKLRQDGLAVYVAPLERGGKTLHRVRVGPQATRQEAERIATRLKGQGLPAAVVAAN